MAPMRNNATGIALARSASSNTPTAAGQTLPVTPVAKSVFPLQRGSACLSCRKRKMKCDAGKPVCQQCVKGNRPSECEYDDGKSKSRTQMLQEKVNKLQNRVKELESRPSRRSSTTPPSPNFPVLQATHPSPVYSAIPQPPTHQTALNNSSYVPIPHATSYGYQPSDVHPLIAPNDPYAHPNTYIPHSRSSSNGSGSPIPAPEYGLPVIHNQLSSGPTQATTTAIAAAPVWNYHLSDETQWWEHEDLTPQWRQTLLDIFLPHRHQASFSVHVPSFIMAIQSPSIPASAKPHPALMNTIYLLATHFAPPGALPHVELLETIFLERATAHLGGALEYSDRLVNVIQASCLLATWFFMKGRLLEGYYHSSSAGRLAIGLGLHQIRSDVFRFPSSSPSAKIGEIPGQHSVDGLPRYQEEGLLLPPTSRMEIGERILTFWQVFNIDRCWSVATDLPSGLVDDDHPRTRVLTIWPKEVEEYMDYHTPGQHQHHPSPSPPPTIGGGNTFLSEGGNSITALRAKATALFERASRLRAGFDSLVNLPPTVINLTGLGDQQQQQPQQQHSPLLSNPSLSSTTPTSSDKYWSDFRSLQFAITRFISGLPSLSQASAGPMSGISSAGATSRSPGRAMTFTQSHSPPMFSQMEKAMLFLTRNLAHVAVIQLHHTFSGKDMSAHERCLEAAAVVVGLMSEIGEEDYEFLDPIIGTCWMCAADVLIREVVRRTQLTQRVSPLLDVQGANANAGRLSLVNRQLDTIIAGLKRLAAVFPLASYQVGKVEQSRLEAGF